MKELTTKIKSPFDVWVDHHDEITARWGRGKDLSIISLPSLDERIWGFKKKSLVVIGGRPSQGKSTLMLQLAWDFVKQQKKVYFFTLEMTSEDCIERLWALDQELDNFLITTGKIGTLYNIDHIRSQRDNFHNKLKDIDNKGNLVLIEGYGKTFFEINKVVEKLGDADAVFIDYLQMIKEKTNSKTAIDEYIKDLRHYAIEKDFCAIVGSQINRGSHDQHKIREPEMWELKGSGSIEEHCDVCILVHWDWFYKREEDNKEDYLIKVCKNRRGRSGRFQCRFQPQFFKVSEYEDADERVDRPRKDLD